MHYLVTGGLGFIGSHLGEALARAGHRLTVLDDLSTGKREHLPPGARLIEADVRDADAVTAALANADGCFHLAAVASVERARREWKRCHEINCGGTVSVLSAAAARRVPVVMASSAAVYGNPPVPLLDESMPPAPASAYGADKRASELHARVAWETHGIPTVALRLFNVFGPRQMPDSPYSGVISVFIARLLAGQPLHLHGDGAQTRDFVFVGDAVRAFLAAMERLREERLRHAICNVCTGAPVSIRGLAEMLAAQAPRPLLTESHPPRAGDIRHSCGDPAAARALLDFTARTTLQEGLAATWAYQRDRVK